MTKVSPVTLNGLLTALPQGTAVATQEKIQQAYNFALEAQADKRRESGELYIEHDLAVANILLQLGLDSNTIIAGLLHDSLYPHTGKTESDLKPLFNEDIVSLVVGLKNLRDFTDQEIYKRHQQENNDGRTLEVIRRAVLSIIEWDIRVIMIRMVDSLQDLRMASKLPAEKEYEVANEAMNIYAPLANRLGIWQLKWELEDLAFRHLHPVQYKEIAQKLDERRTGRAEKVEAAIGRLRVKISEMGIKAAVTGRPKHIYSIYRKMERKHLPFEEIHDIQALRVILDPTTQADYANKNSKEKDEIDRSLCYQVLGAVHSVWQPIPKEFDDYIATPKANGYRSLHTAVIDNETGQTLEIQIRTTRMHEEAERGVAAHWAYKEGKPRVSASVQKRIQNLRDLLAAIRDSGDPYSEIEFFETELAAERIYVYTPRGDVIELPIGSTPIDFAYQIHTEVGHRCRGARVNGKMVSLDYKLKSGDKVEIITGKRGGPSRDWMNHSLGYTGSARSRSKIRGWFREQEWEQNVEQGREAVERELKRLGLHEDYTIEEISQALKYDDVDQFLAKVGFGDIQSAQISGAIAILKRKLKPDDELHPLLQPQAKPKGLTVKGVSGLHTKMAGCCHPIPPEPIIGYITRGQGVTIHRMDCAQAAAITERERIIEVDWGTEMETFPIPIVVKAYRRANLIDEIVSTLRGQQINVTKTKTTSDGTLSTVFLVAEVTSLDQLNWLLQKLENLPNVVEAYRQRWT
ncbi:MAG: bifunctional (p)ppGpp synthetase/guanosine-3',5'-bis(diphosphate) 3'-pyrophosphohydrolase [Ardenticatenaceae bacterium]|nr:bifunctional (p)ppGpp synthetase/guanosine-3',5'-bis(diphosphate) 3'-pyrophosphohydrolase [Ardenticatenaceae bacterium]MCB9444752.1 bifunctional (p)ppGpp synthetase/guanosine-3',5'-bis(diphosphate) 3'-pyrophosphohydrolase [Ardenticatenaceae bacterium]